MGVFLNREEATHILSQIRCFVTRTKQVPGKLDLMHFYDGLIESCRLQA
jgi:hypothetical protein